MKKRVNFFLIGLILIAAAAAVMNCKPGGFILDVRDLKGETIIYITNGNGRNYYKFTFNEEGTGGEFEEVKYKFDYPTEDAYNSSDYTKKVWFMYDGSRGTFTYDPETKLTQIAFTESYIEAEGAVTPYFAADYNWVPYKTDVLGYNAPAEDSVTFTMESYMYFNNDTPIAFAYLRQGEESNDWSYMTSSEKVTTAGGVTTTVIKETTRTYTVTEEQIVEDILEVETTTVGGGTPDVYTEHDIRTYIVNGYFIAGENTGDREYDDVWEEGNTLTFLAEQIREDIIWYEGETPPDPPTVDPSTGEGVNTDGTTYSYSIYMDRGSPELDPRPFDFIHQGEVIFRTYDFMSSYRGVR